MPTLRNAVRCRFQGRGCPMCRFAALRSDPSVSANPRGSELGKQWAARATSEVWGRYRRGSSESSLTCHHAIFGEVKFPDSKPRKRWWDPPLLDVNSQNPTAEQKWRNFETLQIFFGVLSTRHTAASYEVNVEKWESERSFRLLNRLLLMEDGGFPKTPFGLRTRSTLKKRRVLRL